MKTRWLLDEEAHAGGEHLRSEYVAGYDRKAGFDVDPDIELLRRHGLGPDAVLVDIGAGTGVLAAAAAPLCRRAVAVDPSPAMLAVARGRGGFECVRAGFLTYQHAGDAPLLVYSRNALHHLPDFWKAVALRRISSMLVPGGVFVLRDIVYSFEPDEADGVFEAWFAAAPAQPEDGWTRAELEAHVAGEHSTFSWLLEPMLEHAGFALDDVWHSETRTYARYVCTKR
jgi:SAM-dependent methyltransferase